MPGTRSAYAEWVRGGRYVEVRIDRIRAARFGLSLADVQQVVALAIGGENIGETSKACSVFRSTCATRVKCVTRSTSSGCCRVAAEFGVIMLVYLDHAIAKRRAADQFHTLADLIDAIEEGAVLRVRPKAMTVAVIIAGLLPIMFGGGTGSEVMRRIAAPMVGGMVTAPILSMLVLPAAYLLIHRRELRRSSS